MASSPDSAVLTLPLRFVFALSNPSDLPRFDDAGLWREIEQALTPLAQRGAVALERCASTEIALRHHLGQGGVHVLYVVAHSRERPSAHYAAVELTGSDGRARNLTMPALGVLTATSSSLVVVVLQGCSERDPGFQMIAEMLAARALVAITAPPLAGRSQRLFVAKLAASLVAGLNADALERELLGALTTEGSFTVRVLARDRIEPVLRLANQVPASPRVEAPSVAEVQDANGASMLEALRQKRASGLFDVFLCHNTADKPAVMRIGNSLKGRGILPWLDVWELPPGQPWQPILEQQIANIRSAAVFIGSAGLGPWQEQEMYGFLRELVTRKVPVIPVLLTDAPAMPELPVFLRAVTCIDFRTHDLDPLDSLVWGITGQRHDDSRAR